MAGTIFIPTTQAVPRTGRDGFVSVGVNGKVTRIPVGVDYVASDDEINALTAANVPMSRPADPYIPSGSVIFPQGRYGSQVSVVINGVRTDFQTATPVTLSVEQKAVVDRRGFEYMSPGSGTVTPPVTPAVLNYPRIAVIGPSTDAQNVYGTSGPARGGVAASGPLSWALARDRRARILEFTTSASPYMDGDVKAVFGAQLAAFDAQISAAVDRKNAFPSDSWMASYNPGRNDLENGGTFADYQTAVPRHIAALRSAGFPWIMVANLVKKPTAQGGVWAVGGTARTAVDQINAWLNATYGSAPDIIMVDEFAALTDAASADQNPVANVYRSDNTHLTNVGGEIAGDPYNAALLRCCAPHPYVQGPGLTVPEFGGTGGAVSGTGVSGTVVDGWTLSLSAAGPTVVASVVSVNGKPYQRITVSNTSGIGANGVTINFTKNTPVAVAAGERKSLRARFRSSTGNIKWTLFAQFGSATNQGDTAIPAARAPMFAGIGDASIVAAVTAGATWAAAPGFLTTRAKDLWVESSNYVQGATGGSNADAIISIIVGPGTAGETVTFDIGEVQDFLYPYQS